jgi:hypothetical protein
MKKNKDNNNFIVKYIKDAIYPSISMGGIMAVICLIACRDDPLKENIYRVIGAIVSTFLFMIFPIIWLIFVSIITLPLHLIDYIKKQFKKTKK